jgi:nucleolar complex protein 3
MDRVSAYIKRLMSICVHLPPHGAIAVTSLVSLLLQKYPKTQQLLDNDDVDTSLYLPEIADPEHCNALASALNEVILLKVCPRLLLIELIAL